MKKIDLNVYNWNHIQHEHNNGIFWCNLPKKFNISRELLDRANKEGFIRKIYHNKKHKNCTKKKISVARKKYLKNNPDKHPWKNKNKLKSKPCEILKNELNKIGVIFIEEYQPSNDRYFAIDIAFPNSFIGVEVNGNQHYNNDGSLKQYYCDRNNYLNSIGWKIIDVHYSIIYDNYLLNKLIDEIANYSININDLNYYKLQYFKRIQNKNKCIDCGCIIHNKSLRCVGCNAKNNRKVVRPSKNQLINYLKKYNWSIIGRKYGVSDNTIRNWAKQYKII